MKPALRRARFVASPCIAALVALAAPVHPRAQGRCLLTAGAPQCVTTPIAPVFAPTGWKTVALDHITIGVADPAAEAAFYAALMGWTPRSIADGRAVLDIGTWGTVVFHAQTAAPGPAPATAPTAAASAPQSGGRAGRGAASRATVESLCFVIEPWDAASVKAVLESRGLTPQADNDGRGFESFHVKDPDGFDLQVSNGGGFATSRRTPADRAVHAAMPFAPTAWHTVWLDHLSYSVSDYKKTTSFYVNLLGWSETYDEGSQNELLMGDVGDIIIRGGNPLAPGGIGAARGGRIDHISFGIQPWETDGVKHELEARGLRAQIDTSSKHQDANGQWVADDIHTAQFKSYHTQTPNGYNLQISYVTKENRLALSNAVRPKAGG